MIAACAFEISHSRWTPGLPGLERGKAKKFARLKAKVDHHPGEWRKIELTFARFNTAEFTRSLVWGEMDVDGKRVPVDVKVDGAPRDAGLWFELARKKRFVGEFKRRVERRLKCKTDYFKAAEFQEDGWLHYHLIFRVRGRAGRKAMIGKHLLQELWGWGFVWERPVDDKAVAYACKGVAYASKGLDVIPEYLHKKTSATKLTSTSRGFYLDSASRPKYEPKGGTRLMPTIGQLQADPRMGMQTKLRIVDAGGVETVRKVKGGDMGTLVLMLSKLARYRHDGCSRVVADFTIPLGNGGEGGAAAPPPSLVQYLHCGVSQFVDFIQGWMELAEMEIKWT